MYSWEIDQKMKEYDYNIPSFLYIDIISNSPQIRHIKYNPYDNYFEIWTDEGDYWKFKVYIKER